MPTSSPHLLWLQGSAWRCSGGASALAQEATLLLHFEAQTLALQLELGYCPEDKTYLADLPLVEEALEEAGFTLMDALGFSVDELPVQAEVWLGASLGALPWDSYVAGAALGSEWREQPLPPTPELKALPQESETWLLAQAPGMYYQDERGQATLSHVALVVSQAGLVRNVTLSDQPPGPKELRDLVAKGCARPPNGLPPLRPEAVLTDDPFVVEQLGEALAELGIRVEAGEVSLALEALDALKEALDPEPIPAYFSTYPEGEVKAFFKVAASFFQTRPWEVMDGGKFLAFRLAEGPWHYANLMGQAGEEFGLAMFGDWLEVCRMTNNPETFMDLLETMTGGADALPKSLLATGGAESMSLSPLQALAPEDAAFLKQLKVKPSWRKHYAAVHRYTPEGMEPPTFAPAAYTGLMSILAERAQKVRGNQVSSIKAKTQTPQGELEVRYPAKGDEGSSREGYFRFQVPFRLGALSPTPGAVLWAEVAAPGEAKWHRVMAALTKAAKHHPHVFPWISQVKQGDYLLWLDQAPVKEPSPTVEQLAGLEGLTLQMSQQEEPLVLTPLSRPSDDEVRVRFLNGDG